MRKKIAVALSVVVAGVGAAHFFRKDASWFGFWHDARSANPFFAQVERRATADPSWAPAPAAGPAATPPRQAIRVTPTTAAIAQPGGNAASDPVYQRGFSPVAALLEPIEAVAPEDEEIDEPQGGLAPAASVTDSYVAHTIADGDTLSRLAGQYLGRTDRYLEIYELNRDILASPDLLPIGKTLRIPLREADAPSSDELAPGEADPGLRLVPLKG